MSPAELETISRTAASEGSSHSDEPEPEVEPAEPSDTEHDEPVPEPDEPDEPAVGSASTRKARRWLLRLILGFAIAVAVAACSTLAYVLHRQHQLDELHQQAGATTREYLVAMAAFDYQNLDANKGTITARSTADFARKYDDMVAALRDIVVTSKGVASATADHVAVERLDERSATVVGFVDQHVTNVVAPQGNDQRYRMVVTLVRSGDQWIVDNVETV